MIITEAIARADSWQAVFFLLTAYIEAMQFDAAAAGLPEHLTGLPLGSTGELAARHECLAAFVNRSAPAAPAALELSQVYAAALQRLRTLEGQWPRAA